MADSAVLGQPSLVAHATARRSAAPAGMPLRTNTRATPKRFLSLAVPLESRVQSMPTRASHRWSGFGDFSVLPQRKASALNLPTGGARRFVHVDGFVGQHSFLVVVEVKDMRNSGSHRSHLYHPVDGSEVRLSTKCPHQPQEPFFDCEAHLTSRTPHTRVIQIVLNKPIGLF
jgi:hypothetical protein